MTLNCDSHFIRYRIESTWTCIINIHSAASSLMKISAFVRLYSWNNLFNIFRLWLTPTCWRERWSLRLQWTSSILTHFMCCDRMQSKIPCAWCLHSTSSPSETGFEQVCASAIFVLWWILSCCSVSDEASTFLIRYRRYLHRRQRLVSRALLEGMWTGTPRWVHKHNDPEKCSRQSCHHVCLCFRCVLYMAWA
jgi:hypothetical protein